MCVCVFVCVCVCFPIFTVSYFTYIYITYFIYLFIYFNISFNVFWGFFVLDICWFNYICSFAFDIAHRAKRTTIQRRHKNVNTFATALYYKFYCSLARFTWIYQNRFITEGKKQRCPDWVIGPHSKKTIVLKLNGVEKTVPYPTYEDRQSKSDECYVHLHHRFFRISKT